MPFESLFIIFWRLMKVCIRFWKSWENFKIVLNLDCFNNFSRVMTSSDDIISCLVASQSFKWNDVQISWDRCILHSCNLLMSHKERYKGPWATSSFCSVYIDWSFNLVKVLCCLMYSLNRRVICAKYCLCCLLNVSFNLTKD